MGRFLFGVHLGNVSVALLYLSSSRVDDLEKLIEHTETTAKVYLFRHLLFISLIVSLQPCVFSLLNRQLKRLSTPNYKPVSKK